MFNRGRTPYAFTATPSAPWIVLSQSSGTVQDDLRIDVSIDWARAPAGDAGGSVTVRGAGGEVVVAVSARKPAAITRESLQGFAEGAGYVSIEAEHYSQKIDAGERHWARVENYGHTLSAMRTVAPPAPDAAASSSAARRPCLATARRASSTGCTSSRRARSTTRLTLGPILNFAPDRGVRLAVSFDDEPPQVVTVVPQGYNAQNGNRDWEQSVRDNARLVTTTPHDRRARLSHAEGLDGRSGGGAREDRRHHERRAAARRAISGPRRASAGNDSGLS